MAVQSRKRAPGLNLLDLPHDVLTEVIARVGEDSIGQLAYTKLTCKQLESVATESKVYRRAGLHDRMILLLLDENSFHAPAAEKRFLKECCMNGNPFKSYADALYKFTMKADVQGCLDELQRATVNTSILEAITYLKCLALAFNGNISEQKVAIDHFRLLKAKSLDQWISANSFFLYKFLSTMKWQQFQWMLPPKVQPICPDRSAHRVKRYIKWRNIELSDECVACDVDREVDAFIHNVYH